MKKYRYKKHSGERQPVYEGQTKRIISVPNGLWMAQVRIGESVQKWEDVSRATTKIEAMRFIKPQMGDQT